MAELIIEQEFELYLLEEPNRNISLIQSESVFNRDTQEMDDVIITFHPKHIPALINALKLYINE